MKRSHFYFKSVLLSLAILSLSSSFAKAETTTAATWMFAEVPYEAFIGSGDLRLIFRPIESDQPFEVQINANVFREGYFGILPLPVDWATLERKTGCAANVYTGLSGMGREGMSIATLNPGGKVVLTRTSVVSIGGISSPTIGIYAEVLMTYQTAPAIVDYSRIKFTPADFFATCPDYVPPIDVAPIAPTFTDSSPSGEPGVLFAPAGSIATTPTPPPPPSGDSDTIAPEAVPHADAPRDVLAPAPSGPFAGFQGGGCQLGGGPTSAPVVSALWLLGLGAAAMRRFRKK